MRIKNYIAAALLAASVTCVQAQWYPTGVFTASDFAQWSLPTGITPANGMLQWQSGAICQVLSGGYSFTAIRIGRPLTIIDAIPGHTETVTPTAVTINGTGCTVAAVMLYSHFSYTVTSGTGGLQEAIDYAARNTSAIISLTPSWAWLGGNSGMVSSATGQSGTAILDERTGTMCSYLWDGSSYVSQGCSGDGASLGQTALQTFSGPIGAPSFIGPLTGHASLDLPLTGGTLSGNLNGLVFNATVGFQLNGAAPLNHCLLGDGTSYVDSASCGGGGGGSGTVNTALANQIAFYAANGTTVSGTAHLTDNGTVIASTLPVTASSFTGAVTGHASLDLAAANNFSDVANAATALSNLGGAPLASPGFTGTPTAPTVAMGDNSNLIADTAFVINNTSGSVSYTTSQTASMADFGKLVKMNCAAPPCVYTLPATLPAGFWRVAVISTGASPGSVALGGSDTYNGGTTPPALPAFIWANSNFATAYLGISVASSSIASIQITTGTTLLTANSCTASTAASMPGVLTTTTFIPPTPTVDTSAITGWGSSGGLAFTFFPTANAFNWRVCNTTGSSITPGSSVTWNVGAQ